jgi:hypothetical protein
MKPALLTFLLLPTALLAAEIRIAVGMDRDAAIALIQKNGGTDIGDGLAVVGPNGEYPLRGVYWEFREYDAIITITAQHSKVSKNITAMTFWRKNDFGESKMHRQKTEQKITTLKLDTATKEATVEK